uniref:Uncharacterized protein n=1 Tax=Anguilla anguilla TaxID=7936 RepID=A0A0E9R0Q4_ANGAN
MTQLSAHEKISSSIFTHFFLLSFVSFMFGQNVKQT